MDKIDMILMFCSYLRIDIHQTEIYCKIDTFTFIEFFYLYIFLNLIHSKLALEVLFIKLSWLGKKIMRERESHYHMNQNSDNK